MSEYKPLPNVDNVTLKPKNLDYLTSVLGIRKPIAKTYLLTRKGYSSSAISKRVDVSESTIKKYLKELEEKYGKNTTLTMNYINGPILEPLPTNIDEEQSGL